MRGLKLKIITKQETTLKILQDVKDAGYDISGTVVQPSMDNLWIPATLDDIYGAGVRGTTGIAKTVEKGTDAALNAAADAYDTIFGRATKIVDGVLYRKYGFSPKQIEDMQKKYPDVQIIPRYVVCTAKEIAEIALNKNNDFVNDGKLIQTLMHGSIPEGCISDYDGEILDFGPARHVVEKDPKTGKWDFYGVSVDKKTKKHNRITQSKKTPHDKVKECIEKYEPEDQEIIWKNLKEQLCCQDNSFSDACAGCSSLCASGCAVSRIDPEADWKKQADKMLTDAFELRMPQEGQKKFSLGKENFYGPVYLSDERIDSLIKEYGSSSANYSQALVTKIKPNDFLWLTSSDPERIRKEAKDIDWEELQGNDQTPYLKVDMKTGKVTGHEGRHRVAALERAGADSVAIAVIPEEKSFDRYNAEKIDQLVVTEQFQTALAPMQRVYLRNMIPVNEANREEIRKEYGEKKPYNRIAGRKYSIGKERDREYMAAVESGDMGTAQRMVDQAAKAAGYDSPKLYHGTPDRRKRDNTGEIIPNEDWNVFDPNKSNADRIDGSALFFANNKSVAEFYAPKNGNKNAKIFEVYLKQGKVLTVDGNGANWNRISIPSELPKRKYRGLKNMEYSDTADTTYICKEAKKAGYDSVHFKNIIDGTLNNKNMFGDVYAVFDPSQVKSADAVTYDDKGNVIPLSERFDARDADIRYSYARENPKVSAEMGELVKAYNAEMRGVFYNRSPKDNRELWDMIHEEMVHILKTGAMRNEKVRDIIDFAYETGYRMEDQEPSAENTWGGGIYVPKEYRGEMETLGGLQAVNRKMMGTGIYFTYKKKRKGTNESYGGIDE
ncbi:MAG: hypothetical protein ACI4PP_05250, partial [Clostridia bacterium]